MKYISFVLVLLILLQITPFSVAFAEENEKVIIISEEVGEVIDAEERERFGLWPEIKGFKSTIFLQLSDGSYVAEVIYEKNGEEKKARTPQSEIAIKLLKSYIEKVLNGEIQPSSLADEGKYASYTKGELVSISDKVGASIDVEERSEYALFMNIQDFERATFYSLIEGGYLIEIQTQTDTLTSVVLDTEMASILGDYVERCEEVKADRESFERKWSIISYDGQGIPITENEMVRYHKKGCCCALACGLGGSVVGLITGAVLALLSAEGDLLEIMESERTGIFVSIGTAVGGIAGCFIGNNFDNKLAKGGIVKKIEESRTPK
jgi:hypothetical protein